MLNDHAGKQGVRVTLTGVCSPVLWAVLPEGTDVEQLTAKIQAAFEAAIASHFEHFDWAVIAPRIELQPFVIKTREEGLAELERLRDTPEEAARKKAAYDHELDTHPDNGKEGWWYVEGIRHDARVKASSARQAISMAVTSGHVGSWEVLDSRCASFIAESPEVM